MIGTRFRIEALAPCGGWSKIQTVDPARMEFSDIPKSIRERKRTARGPSVKDAIWEDYARLIYERWLDTLPSRTLRMVKEVY